MKTEALLMQKTQHNQLHYFLHSILFCAVISLIPMPLHAKEDEITVVAQSEKDLNERLETLDSILKIESDLKETLTTFKSQLKSSISDAEKQQLQDQIAIVERKLLAIDNNFEEIATQSDLSLIKENTESQFSLEEEVITLLKPILEEMNHVTQDVRKKSELRERLAEYKEKQKLVEEVKLNVERLIDSSEDRKNLKTALQEIANYWAQQENFIDAQKKSTALQLRKLEASDVTFAESTQSYFKQFFQKRGFYLFQAFSAILFILLISQFSRYLFKRFIPGFSRHPRNFRMRLFDLLHRLITLILLIIGPMLVFYMAEDWVLFSLGILLVIGIAWTLRTAIPEYWGQIQLFLNIGAVREGERIFLEGLPWRVSIINIYSILENPVAGIRQRIPIKELLHLKSRPIGKGEPWFPCSMGDWVILSDGIRGKVIGISHEMVKLVQRGGAHKTYLTPEFLALSPLNIAVNFRIKETIGVSYDLQDISTTKITTILESYIQKRVQEEGYDDDLLNLKVEFEKANESSLDIVVIADFKGHLGDVYSRLRRSIQRWCVDACTENDWEIPFAQITLHHAKNENE